MKMLAVSTEMKSEHVFIPDDKLADVAHAAIKAAMESYDKYGNDTAKTVSVATGCGELTYRVANIIGVHIDDCGAAESQIIEREVWKRQLEAKIAARLAPSNG